MKRLVGIVMVIGAACSFVFAQDEAAENGWDTTLALGAALTAGNSETLTANGAATTARASEKHDFRCGIEANCDRLDRWRCGGSQLQVAGNGPEGAAPGHTRLLFG